MATLDVQSVTFNHDQAGQLHFWGEVANTGDTTQRWVKVTVSIFGAGDHKTAERSDLVGLEWITPGLAVPFHIAFENPPDQFERYTIAVEGREHDFASSDVPQPHLTLDVSQCHYREIDRAGLLCSIVGMISNSSIEDAEKVKVAGTLYGPQGQVVGVLSPYLVSNKPFRPGDKLTFELKYYALNGVVTNFQVQVQGRKAERW